MKSVIELADKIVGQTTDIEIYGEEELRIRMHYIRRCAECIIAISTPGYDEEMRRVKIDPGYVK